MAGAAFSCQHSFSLTQGASRPDISDLTIATGFAEKRQSPAKPIGAYSAAQEKATASKNQAQEDIDDIDEIFKIFNRN